MKTWTSFHQAWFGDLPILPLTPDIIRRVSAAFKDGKYSTYPNYMSRMKDAHTEAGHPWTPLLERAATNARRSVLRHIGPPVGAMALPLASIALLPWISTPSSSYLPINIIPMIIIASMFMLREVEVSALRLRHVCLDTVRRTIRLYLASSKTDVTARGCYREWGCLCGSHGHQACPYCAGLRHRDSLQHRFGRALHDDFPFFPTSSGSVPSKSHVVAAMREAADAQQLPKPDHNRDYTGHSFRVTGAQFLAAIGIDIFLIQLLARWASDVVLRYVREAPLVSMTAVTKQKLSLAAASGTTPFKS